MNLLNSTEKKVGLVLRLAVIAAIATVIVCLCACSETFVRPTTEKVKVALIPSDGITVVSNNIVDVVPGKSAEFQIKVNDGYIYQGNSAGAYYNPKTGKLTLSVVKYPTSVEFFLLNTNNMLKLELECPLASLVSYDGEDEWYDNGDTVKVTAFDSTSYNFVGWSSGAYLEDGGKLISTDLEYTFVMESSTKIFANYRQADQYTIIYHANGGKVAKTGEDTIRVSSKRDTIFTCRNTIHSNGTFVREGYMPVGYSTEPVNFEDYTTVNDIPGFSNMGGVCVVPDDTCTLELYVVWAKEQDLNDFYFEMSGGEMIVKKYRGKDKIVVIPETNNGIPITRIKEGAFAGSNVTNVVLSRNIKIIDDNGFGGCYAMKQIVFFDSVNKVSNNAFTGCSKLSTIVLNSQRLSHYAGSAEGTFCIKYMRVKTAPGKMLVVVSGSSTLNGMKSEVFQERYPDYTIVNYGTNAGTPSYFYLNVISNYVGKGDIIIHAGEHGSTTMGSNQIQWKLFRGNEQCYDIFREVDMTKYTNFWNAYQEFQNDRGSSVGKPYQTPCGTMNEYGDLTNNRTVNNGFKASGSYDFTKPSNYLSSANAGRLNEINSIIVSKGGTMLGSFATLDLDAVAKACKNNQAAYDQYTLYFRNMLNYPVISNVGTYVMEHHYFYDSIWHCTFAGADIRTANLLADLDSYFEDPTGF
ncbi:MAG: leucine-rich repeat protein [Clostridia bacterium]|nr:leucine-rich repeat protein [Clostridia bacterium]